MKWLLKKEIATVHDRNAPGTRVDKPPCGIALAGAETKDLELGRNHFNATIIEPPTAVKRQVARPQIETAGARHPGGKDRGARGVPTQRHGSTWPRTNARRSR